jgi:hypothetical protein
VEAAAEEAVALVAGAAEARAQEAGMAVVVTAGQGARRPCRDLLNGRK